MHLGKQWKWVRVLGPVVVYAPGLALAQPQPQLLAAIWGVNWLWKVSLYLSHIPPFPITLPL